LLATPPTITAQPQDVTVADGAAASFTVSASGPAPLGYQWQRDLQPIAGATSATYRIPAVSLQDNGSVFAVVVTNSAGMVTSDSATLAVAPSTPSIVRAPQAVTIDDGQSAAFTVVAAGSVPLFYQWLRNGAPIPAASGTSYTLPVASFSDNGANFAVVVRNVAGTATSNAVTLTVHAVAPTISTQPHDQAVVAGARAGFSVIASGTTPLTFQWNENGAPIQGATGAQYTTPVASVADSGARFSVLVSDPAGSTPSSSAMLTVTAAPVAPSIITAPQSQSVTAGDTASFSVVASGSDPLSYQWYRNGVAINGATNAAYSLSPVTQQNNGDAYYVTVTNIAGSTSSTTALLTVTAPVGTITLLAGQPGAKGYVDGTGSAARFNAPRGAAIDSAGNMFVVDGCAIREVTPSGVVTTFAGVANDCRDVAGPIAGARFAGIGSIAIDSHDNLFVTAGGCNTDSSTNPPSYLCNGQTVREISSGTVSTLAGSVTQSGYADGTGSAALFSTATGIALDANGNVYVADTGNDVIRKVTPAGVVTTIAGTNGVRGAADGTGASASFATVIGLAVDTAGAVYVADVGNNNIRKITPAGIVSTLAGTAGVVGSADGTGGAAQFDYPEALAVGPGNNIYVSDTLNNTIRMITPTGGVTTFAGAPAFGQSADGTGNAARFNQPNGIAADASGNLYVADTGNGTVRTISPAVVVATLAGLPAQAGSVDGTGSTARFDFPAGVTVDSSGNIDVVDLNNSTVRTLTTAGVVTTLAGTAGVVGSADGTGTAARFTNPSGMTVAGTGILYVADTGNDTIRAIAPGAVVSTLAGSVQAPGSMDGTGAVAQFNSPTNVASDGAGNIYVADTKNDTVRKITPAGLVSTIAGSPGIPGSSDGATGDLARFNAPAGIAVDSSGTIYVSDSGNNTIRTISSSGVVRTLAGLAGASGATDGGGQGARFDDPTGIAADNAGNLYVADSGNGTVRKVTPAGLVTTVAGVPHSTGVTLGPLPGSFNRPWGIALMAGSGTNLVVTDAGANAVLLVHLP
jgi:sugar lactone lactonase YvrE